MQLTKRPNCVQIRVVELLFIRSYLKGGSGGSERMQQFRPSEFDENSSDDDDEERRNTYNGNSTEQQ